MNTTTKTIHIDIEIPEKLLFSLGEDISLFRGNIKLYAAIFLFQSHKLSLGKSAEFAGVSKDYFLDLLNQYKIPIIDYSKEDLDEELLRLQEC
jgi:predicted HTH domain antitoxin